MSLEFNPVPLDGSIHPLPAFLDYYMDLAPSTPFAKFPSIDDPDKVTTISYSDFAKATHRVAHALCPDGVGTKGEVVAVLVHCDSILYMALLIGMMRAGMVPFPMSPRNSPEAVIAMLQKTHCHRLVASKFTDPLSTVVQKALVAKGYILDLMRLPSIRSIFPCLYSTPPDVTYDATPYPFHVALQKPDDVVLIIHSSGSTGIPKPIPQTHKILLQWCRSSAATYGRGSHGGSGAAMLPSFHTMGIFVQILYPLSAGHFVGLYTPQEPALPIVPNPSNMLQMLQVTGCTTTVVVPVIVEAWAQSQDAVSYLKTLDVIGYAGGPISDDCGAKLSSSGLNLVSIYGSTETGVSTVVYGPQEREKPVEWAWMTFDSMYKCHWNDQGNGTYELQFLTHDGHQPAVENIVDIKGYATSDLFKPHPTKKGLWKAVGRTDDVLVLASGEKVVALPQENHLNSVPFIAGVVVFGRGRHQVGVLLEPKPNHVVNPGDEKALVEFRNEVWPFVEEANKRGPTFARIYKEMILVTDPKKPMMRSGKGTPQRKATLAAYADEIQELYKAVEDSRNTQRVSPPTLWDITSVADWLFRCAASIYNERELKADVDLFEQGFDSLSATFLRNQIIGALSSATDAEAQKAANGVTQDFVFNYSTLRQLTIATIDLINNSSSQPDRTTSIKELISRFSDLPQVSSQESQSSSTSIVVLTGSTGALGSHILASLLLEPQVTKVYTLNRGKDIQARQKLSFSQKGLPEGLLVNPKLTQLTADLSHPTLGLDEETFEKIKSSATHFVHNAWKMDFNLSLASFHSYIAETHKLVNIVAQFSEQVLFLYSSSISVANGWDTTKGPIPECVIENEEYLAHNGRGYECSKYVVEHILANARRKKVLQTTSLRIGQISGSTRTGAWNSTEWVPSIIKSGVSINALPTCEQVISWVPIDIVSRAITDVVISHTVLPEVINIVHPRPLEWNTVTKHITQALAAETRTEHLPSLPIDEWVAKVSSAGAKMDESLMKDLPVLKMPSFLMSLAGKSSKDTTTFDTSTLERISRTFAEAPTINEEQVGLWVKYWLSKDFL